MLARLAHQKIKDDTPLGRATGAGQGVLGVYSAHIAGRLSLEKGSGVGALNVQQRFAIQWCEVDTQVPISGGRCKNVYDKAWRARCQHFLPQAANDDIMTSSDLPLRCALDHDIGQGNQPYALGQSARHA